MELKDTTVLVVDDERMLLDIFSEWLTEENSSFHCLTGSDLFGGGFGTPSS